MPKPSLTPTAHALLAAAAAAFLLLSLTPAIIPTRYTPGRCFTCDTPVPSSETLGAIPS